MNVIVKELRGNYERGFDFLFRQIDEAPDAVWGKKEGGFLYWQQIYHAFVCVDYFLLPEGGAFDTGPGTMDVAMFKEFPKDAPSKETIREFGKKKKAQADAWLDGLKDEDLGKKHAGFSSRKGADVSNAAVLATVSIHNFYHVGCCDSVLRDNGHKGVF